MTRETIRKYITALCGSEALSQQELNNKISGMLAEFLGEEKTGPEVALQFYAEFIAELVSSDEFDSARQRLFYVVSDRIPEPSQINQMQVMRRVTDILMEDPDESMVQKIKRNLAMLAPESLNLFFMAMREKIISLLLNITSDVSESFTRAGKLVERLIRVLPDEEENQLREYITSAEFKFECIASLISSSEIPMTDARKRAEIINLMPSILSDRRALQDLRCFVAEKIIDIILDSEVPSWEKLEDIEHLISYFPRALDRDLDFGGKVVQLLSVSSNDEVSITEDVIRFFFENLYGTALENVSSVLSDLAKEFYYQFLVINKTYLLGMPFGRLHHVVVNMALANAEEKEISECIYTKISEEWQHRNTDALTIFYISLAGRLKKFLDRDDFHRGVALLRFLDLTAPDERVAEILARTKVVMLLECTKENVLGDFAPMAEYLYSLPADHPRVVEMEAALRVKAGQQGDADPDTLDAVRASWLKNTSLKDFLLWGYIIPGVFFSRLDDTPELRSLFLDGFFANDTPRNSLVLFCREVLVDYIKNGTIENFDVLKNILDEVILKNNKYFSDAEKKQFFAGITKALLPFKAKQASLPASAAVRAKEVSDYLSAHSPSRKLTAQVGKFKVLVSKAEKNTENASSNEKGKSRSV